MADTETPQTPRLRVLSQYIRDMSFENIAAQKGMTNEVKPEISVQVNLDAADKKENKWEIMLKLQISAKAGDTPIFILELDYAGFFLVENIADEQRHAYLMIESRMCVGSLATSPVTAGIHRSIWTTSTLFSCTVRKSCAVRPRLKKRRARAWV